jgi:hypothetical protein
MTLAPSRSLPVSVDLKGRPRPSEARELIASVPAYVGANPFQDTTKWDTRIRALTTWSAGPRWSAFSLSFPKITRRTSSDFLGPGHFWRWFMSAAIFVRQNILAEDIRGATTGGDRRDLDRRSAPHGPLQNPGKSKQVGNGMRSCQYGSEGPFINNVEFLIGDMPYSSGKRP